MTATKENIKELLESPTDRPVEYQSGFVFGKRSKGNLKGLASFKDGVHFELPRSHYK